MSRPPARTVWIALTTVYIAWGSTYVGIRLMDRTIPPLAGAGVRFLLAGVAMYGFLALRRRRLPRVAPRELASLVLVSILLLTGGNGIVTVAERQVPAGLAALLVASMPLWVLLLRLLAGDRPRAATLVGLAIGFSGVALLVLRGSHGSGASIEHALVVVAGALAWATGSFLSSRLPLPADVSAGTAIEMIVGGAVLAVLAVVFGESWSQLWLHASADSLLALVYLAAIGSIVAFTAYVWLLQNVPISKISTYAYVNPVVAVVLGALVLGEAITGLMVVGGLITVAAVAVVIRSESRASSEPAPVEPPPPPALALEGPAEAC